MTVRVRFAPSPTGRLHVGNVRIALVNWLMARTEGGSFLLRLDDTDVERSTAAFANEIEDDLGWLGLTWDEFARQSDRLTIYEEAAGRLKAAGRLYPCYESAEELALKRKTQMGRGLPPVYDRAALRLTDSDRSRLEAEGQRPHWRFLLDHSLIAWADRVRGEVRFEGAHLSDPVLVREDGRPLYTLSSVVDDIAFAITDVVRGEDHVANTAVQIQLFEALGGDVPAFAHLPLLADAQGGPLSKREGSLSIAALRDDGLESMSINSLLARLGSADPIEPMQTLDQLAAAFDLQRFGRATPKFDGEELRHLNARLLHEMPFEIARPRLASLGLIEANEAFWLAVRGNLAVLADAETWWRVCRGKVVPVLEDSDFIAVAASVLPGTPWDESTWREWTDCLKTETGRKGRNLFKPLRLALTGLDHGPELANLLPLIGRDRALARLSGEAA